MRKNIKTLSFTGLIFAGLIFLLIGSLCGNQDICRNIYPLNTDNVKIIGRSQNAGGYYWFPFFGLVHFWGAHILLIFGRV